ncbi:MAG: hypothetical protein J5555_02320 [Firmicutes bacterium]|nr:hypothetical protein [Bacillota bacterium]
MKRLKRFLLLAGIILLTATSPVFADVAILPAFLIVGGALILAIALIIIAIVLLVKSIRRRKAREKENE